MAAQRVCSQRERVAHIQRGVGMTYHLNSAGCALAAAAIAGTALTFVSCGGTATSPSSSPPSISLTLSLNPSTVVAGGNTQGTITVTGLQGAAATINIAASSAQATPAPATVAIQAGATSATFTVTTSTVSATTTITLTATLTATVSGTDQTASQTATLTITPQAQPPVSLSSCSMNLASVEGGKSTQGTVTLSGAAPAGGAVVQLSSNDTNNVLTLPTSVTVAASSSSATFTVGTREVGGAFQIRSEEHTSELQSPDHLVCRLLLEKKKSDNLQGYFFVAMQYVEGRNLADVLQSERTIDPYRAAVIALSI